MKKTPSKQLSRNPDTIRTENTMRTCPNKRGAIREYGFSKYFFRTESRKTHQVLDVYDLVDLVCDMLFRVQRLCMCTVLAGRHQPQDRIDESGISKYVARWTFVRAESRKTYQVVDILFSC
jgi:ribosomal protein S14